MDLPPPKKKFFSSMVLIYEMSEISSRMTVSLFPGQILTNSFSSIAILSFFSLKPE